MELVVEDLRVETNIFGLTKEGTTLRFWVWVLGLRVGNLEMVWGYYCNLLFWFSRLLLWVYGWFDVGFNSIRVLYEACETAGP